MYLDEVLTDSFWLIVATVVAVTFLYIGRRNYKNANNPPFTPLGKYMLHLYRKQHVLNGKNNEELQFRSRIVRLEALLSIIAGTSMLVIMFLVAIISWLI